MKKLFTLLAAATVALTMNAQEVFNSSFEDWTLNASAVNLGKFVDKGLTTDTFWEQTFSSKSSDTNRYHSTTVVGDANTGSKALSVSLNTGGDATPSVDAKLRTPGFLYTGLDIYEFTFAAKADIEGGQVSANGNDWLTVGTTYTTFTQRDTVDGDGVNGRLFFYFGNVATATTYTIDDLTITKVGVATSISNNNADAFSIYDNADKVEVYNLAGVKVAEASNTTIANIELNSGIYIAVVTKNGQTTKIKFVK
jgi:hypothetical protein